MNSRGDRDYGTGRIQGAVALGADVAIIADSAAKTALNLLGLLHGGDDSLWEPVLEGRNMIHVGLAPHALGHVEVLNRLRHQHMLQSVWMVTEPSPDCEHCGLVGREYERTCNAEEGDPGASGASSFGGSNRCWFRRGRPPWRRLVRR